MEDALYKAKNGQNKTLDITCLHVPPIVMGDVTLPGGPAPALGNGNGNGSHA
jgi:hypothetical protein